jgi:hypothetical protein
MDRFAMDQTPLLARFLTLTLLTCLSLTAACLPMAPAENCDLMEPCRNTAWFCCEEGECWGEAASGLTYTCNMDVLSEQECESDSRRLICD